MKRALHSLILLGLALTTHAQIKLRLDADDVADPTFFTLTNSNSILNGINSNATTTLSVAKGGTAATSLTGILKGNGISPFTAVSAPTGALVGTTDAQTLTNKSFSLATNTLTGSSAQFASAITDETGANKMVFSDNPSLKVPTLITAPGTGAGFWLDGSTLPQRCFFGMEASDPDGSFRIYSTEAVGNVATFDLGTGGVSVMGPITAPNAAFGPASIATNGGISAIPLDVTNQVDANVQLRVTSAGASPKFARIAPSTNTELRLGQNNTDYVTIKVGGQVDIASALTINNVAVPTHQAAFVTTNQSVTNTATLTDSAEAQMTLGVGTYFIESNEMVGSSDFVNAGSKTAISFTGTATVFAAAVLRAGAAAVEPINQAPSYAGTGTSLFTTIGGNGNSFIIRRTAKITVTASGILKLQFAQNTATSGQTATILAGSYVRATKL